MGISLFVQGCRFKCKNCFNSETWDFNGGKEWTKEIKEKFLKLIDRPYIKRISILGGEPLADENLDGVLDLVSEINKQYNKPQDIIVDKENNNNILSKMPNEIRLSSPQKNIWLYTGYIFEEIMNSVIRNESSKKRQDIIKNCHVLVDGRYVDELKNLSLIYRGSSNQRIIDIKKSLKQNEIILWSN